MNIAGRPTRTIWLVADGSGDVEILDQTRILHAVEVVRLCSVQDAARAISDMWVRGAPLIEVTAAYGLCLALRDDAGDDALDRAVPPSIPRAHGAGGIADALSR